MELLPGRRLAVLFLLAAVAGCGRSEESSTAPSRPRVSGQPDVGYIKTPDQIVDKMIELAEIHPGDLVYDLGCGDGRILIAAAKRHGVKGIGIDIDPKVVEEAKENVKANHVEDLVTIRQGDIFETDFSDADVVTMYLMPHLNVQLVPKLKQLKPGSRIVSHSFDMKGARPEKVISFLGKKLYLWRVPWKNE
jgi:cyclopropane fatty-acyl-phospholipid synthase-like methyltransferase